MKDALVKAGAAHCIQHLRVGFFPTLDMGPGGR